MYALQDDARVCGIRHGNFQFVCSVLQCVGRRKQNNGYRNAFGVMQEDAGCVVHGIDSHVKGESGPKQWLNALTIRDAAIDASCPADFPTLVKIHLQGRRLMAEHLNGRVHTMLHTGRPIRLGLDV